MAVFHQRSWAIQGHCSTEWDIPFKIAFGKLRYVCFCTPVPTCNIPFRRNFRIFIFAQLRILRYQKPNGGVCLEVFWAGWMCLEVFRAGVFWAGRSRCGLVSSSDFDITQRYATCGNVEKCQIMSKYVDFCQSCYTGGGPNSESWWWLWW